MVRIVIIFKDGQRTEIPSGYSIYCYPSDLRKFMKSVSKDFAVIDWTCAYFTVDNVPQGNPLTFEML